MKGNYFSVREAAQRVGISRQTMFRHINNGKVSATTDRDGQKQIELTELLRVFGELQPESQSTRTVSNSPRLSPRDKVTTTDTAPYQMEIFKLQAQLELKTAELELAKERISELKSNHHDVATERNRLLDMLERQSLLLAAPKPARQRAAKPVKEVDAVVTKPAKKAAASPAKAAPVKKAAARKPAKAAPVKKTAARKPAKASVKTPPKRKR